MFSFVHVYIVVISIFWIVIFSTVFSYMYVITNLFVFHIICPVTGFENFGCSFCKENRVDGELLLTLTERELERDLGMTNGVSRKRYLFLYGHLLHLANSLFPQRHKVLIFSLYLQICVNSYDDEVKVLQHKCMGFS